MGPEVAATPAGAVAPGASASGAPADRDDRGGTRHRTPPGICPRRRAAAGVAAIALPLGLVTLSSTTPQVDGAWAPGVSTTSTFQTGTYDAVNSYPTHILSSQAVAYWRLDEPVGQWNAEDSAVETHSDGAFSTGVYNGSYVGPPLLGRPPALATQTRTSAEFSGNNQYVRVDDGNGVFDYEGWHSFSTELWVHPLPRGDQQQRYERLVAKQVDQGNGIRGWAVILRRYWDDGQERVAVYFERGPDQVGHVTIPMDEWTHVAATFEGDGISTPYLRLYVNGNQVGQVQASQSGSLPENRSALTIGGMEGSDWFRGRLDDVSVYWYTLEPGAVWSHARRTS